METKKQKELSKKGKIATILVLFLIVIVFFSIVGGSSSDKEGGANDTSVETIDTSNMSPEKRIEATIRASIEEKTNMDKDKIRDIQITSQYDGGWGVLVNFNANDNLSENLIEKGIWEDMTSIYKALYTQNDDVERATLFAYFDTTDKYGNSSESLVLKTSLYKPEAEKVNWDADRATLYQDILPGVWTVGTNFFK